jgi:short-subunit dehydrogenase
MKHLRNLLIRLSLRISGGAPNSRATFMSKKLVVFGASSAISQAYTNLVAERFEVITLVARNSELLEQVAQHTRVITNAEVRTRVADLADISAHSELVREVCGSDSHSVLISYGDLTDQERCAEDRDYALTQFNLNGLSTISLSELAARSLIREGETSGVLGVVGSVAGDRGRRSNYHYGAAKSAVASFLSGLRSEMHPHGVGVVTIKPGFVDTPMTSEFKKGLLWAKPEKVAADIDRAMSKRKSVVYTPWFWGLIMLVIRLIPEPIFKRLSF